MRDAFAAFGDEQGRVRVVAAMRVDVRADQRDQAGGDGHGAVRARCFRGAEPQFAAIIGPAGHGMAHPQRPAVQVDVADPQRAHLAGAHPTRQTHQEDAQPGVVGERLVQALELLRGDRRRVMGVDVRFGRDRHPVRVAVDQRAAVPVGVGRVAQHRVQPDTAFTERPVAFRATMLVPVTDHTGIKVRQAQRGREPFLQQGHDIQDAAARRATQLAPVTGPQVRGPRVRVIHEQHVPTTGGTVPVRAHRIPCIRRRPRFHARTVQVDRATLARQPRGGVRLVTERAAHRATVVRVLGQIRPDQPVRAEARNQRPEFPS